MDYLNFNHKLNDYLKDKEYSFYLYSLKYNIEFLEEAKKRINPFKLVNRKVITLKYEQDVYETETIDLVFEFLNCIDKKYSQSFNQSIIDGSFAFLDSNENLENLSDHSYIKQNKKLYDVLLNNNITDGERIVHEFFHYLNNKKYLSLPYFSELISIYMENEYLDFIKTKGYSKTDIATTRLYRYLDYNYVCNKLYYDSIFLNLKKELGYIDESTYQFINEYKESLNFPDISQNKYIAKLRNIAKNINKFNPDVSYRYFFGTAYSSYLLNNKDGLDRVLSLNDCLMKKNLSIIDSFEMLGLNYVSFGDAIIATNDYYKPSILTYKLKKK